MFRPSAPCVAAAALFCLIFAGCNRSQSASRDPESAANAFFATLERGNPRAAYDSAAFGFQATQTYDAFLSNARELALVGGQPPAWTRKDIRPSEARMDGTLASQLGTPVNVSVRLTAEGNEWRVFSLRTSTPALKGLPEDRFTLVGKGTGFNDVYHQPMPDPEQLTNLVHETVTQFNNAVQSGDFHAFYGTISQQWKDGKRSTGEAAEGVTEHMLKNHFQGFIDKKIDLAPAESGPLVFDRPPIINQDGLLDLHGHINTPDFQVIFDLDYAYELPRWKLFGINFSLTK